MSWTLEDVDTYKEGLSERQKKQWLRIANFVLSTRLKKGDDEATAQSMAVEQASKLINVNAEAETYSLYLPVQDSYEVELKTHQEKPYMIIPVVMMVEGVHNGSHGPLLHTIEELGKFPEAWNGRPITINHPIKDGVNISAGDPEVIDNVTVGTIYNTTVDGKKLRAEAWLNEDKLYQVSPIIHERIGSSEMIEVSIGVFSEEIEEEGIYGGEEYVGIATNHRPDHLAILTEAVGACSCDDGCGLRSNNQNEKDMTIQEMKKTLNLKGVGVNLQTNEEGYREKIEMMYTYLYKLDNKDSYHYLEEMYDDYIIYVQHTGGDRKLFKQSYEIEGGIVNFVGMPTEVYKKVEFVTNASLITKKEVNMSTKECAPCIKEKVNALIANEQSRWTEDDRVFLETLEEGQLDKLAPVIVEKEVEKEVQVNVLSEEDKAALAAYKAEQKVKREKKVAEIQANSSEQVWPTDVLSKMDDDTLDRVHKSTVKEEVVDYSANGGFFTNTSNTDEVLLPTGVKLNENKQ